MSRFRVQIRVLVGAAFALAPLLGVLACGDGESEPSGPTAVVVEGPHDVAVITVRDMGVIRVELLPELAPKTVENFVKLANEGFYDGTTFHRVIPDFMIQGGDPASKNRDPRDDGKGGAGYTIPDEYTDFPQVRGVVSMAHAGPETASCQFFIVQADSPHLDGKYTAFGRVVEGIEVVDAITKVPLDTYGRYGPENRPHPDQVVMHSIRIEPAGAS